MFKKKLKRFYIHEPQQSIIQRWNFVKPQILLILNMRYQNVSKKVLMTEPKFQTKIPCYSRVFLLEEQRKYTLPLNTWYKTQVNVIRAVNSACVFIFVSL